LLIIFVVISETGTVKHSESRYPIRKRKSSDERPSSKENSRLKSCMKSSNKTSAQEPDHKIGPPTWIRKEITKYMLENILVSTMFSPNQHASLSRITYISVGKH
jgi:hypothetical protein